jgi:spermidine synthase
LVDGERLGRGVASAALPDGGVRLKASLWKANFIVFVGSFCTMSLELVAARILAPYIGVSLYTWTSIIGVVLAGISLGNYLGGKLADRAPAQSTLGWLLFLAGIATLGVVLVAQVATGTSLDLPLIPKIVFLTTVIFFLPCCLLGMVSPLVVKLTLQDIQHTGTTIGTIYAFSSLGSIAGTFATGFVLISMIGTRSIVALVGITLVIMALVLTKMGSTKVQATVILVSLLALSWQISQRSALASTCTLETDYFCIKVTEEMTADQRPMRKLVLDHLVHSFVILDDPTHLEYGYEKVYAEMARVLAGPEHTLSALFIGGGGYTFPRYLESQYPGSTLDVVEIDPGVTRIAHTQLGLPDTTSIRSYNEDARQYLMRAKPGAQYDLILGDAFNDLSVPYHLTTREFSERVRKFLKPDGLYLINAIDSYSKGSFMKAFAYTLSKVFPYVYITAPGSGWDWTTSTFVLVASEQPLDGERFLAAQRAAGVDPVTRFLPAAQQADYLALHPVLLTDDYVPVDNMIAPLFVERGF